MEKLTNNPGLQHIAEEIFLNLAYDSLEKCQEIDESWKSILKDPLFWLKKCIKNGQLKETKKSAWIKSVQNARGTNMEEHVIQHLKYISEVSYPIELSIYLERADKYMEFGFSIIYWQGDSCIHRVTSGGLADLAGLEKDDKVVEVNGFIVGGDYSSWNRARRILREVDTSSTIDMKIIRQTPDLYKLTFNEDTKMRISALI